MSFAHFHGLLYTAFYIYSLCFLPLYYHVPLPSFFLFIVRFPPVVVCSFPHFSRYSHHSLFHCIFPISNYAARCFARFYSTIYYLLKSILVFPLPNFCLSPLHLHSSLLMCFSAPFYRNALLSPSVTFRIAAIFYLGFYSLSIDNHQSSPIPSTQHRPAGCLLRIYSPPLLFVFLL